MGEGSVTGQLCYWSDADATAEEGDAGRESSLRKTMSKSGGHLVSLDSYGVFASKISFLSHIESFSRGKLREGEFGLRS